MFASGVSAGATGVGGCALFVPFVVVICAAPDIKPGSLA
jgi:uncharacterized membrane protein YfcA